MKITEQYETVISHHPKLSCTIGGRCGLFAPSLLLFCFTSMPPAAPAADSSRQTFPPFVVEASLSEEHFSADSLLPLREFQSKLYFTISNGWWTIEQEYRAPRELAGHVVNVRKIPDGIRSYTVKRGTDGRIETKGTPGATSWGGILLAWAAGGRIETKGTPAATAEAMPFPDPLNRSLLFAWLAFSPDPELPVIDSRQIRRFSPLPVLKHPDNIGSYTVEYLEPGARFLARLEITDNGVEFGFPNGPESGGVPIPRPVPFDRGFLECVYEVNRVTNYHGVAFPAEATFTLYATDMKGDGVYARFAALKVRASVERVAFDGARMPERVEPMRLFAFDQRPPNLPANSAVEYVVTNDHWLPANDESIAIGASLLRLNFGQYGTPRKLQRPSGWLVVALAAVALLPGILVFRLVTKRERNT